MRIWSIATITMAVALAGSVTGSTQSVGAALQHKKVFGYRDAQTGVFHPLGHTAPDSSIAPTTGTIEVTFNITVKSTFPKGSSIACVADISEQSTNSALPPGQEELNYYDEQAFGVVALNGSTATCTLTIPYSWIVPTPSPTVETWLNLGYCVTAFAGTANNQTMSRSSQSDIPVTNSIPASGTTSRYTVNVVL